MPSIVPGYIYALFASLIVGTIVVGSCGVVAMNMKNIAEKQQLTNLAEYVAAQGNELVLQATRDNVNSTVYLNVPSTVGTDKYWIHLANDSSKVWVEAGFGGIQNNTDQRSYIPQQVTASGIYTSFSGLAILKCETDGSHVYLTINGAN